MTAGDAGMLQTGSVVYCMAGHDKDRFYVVLAVKGSDVWIADGKARKLDKPKRKNQKHVRATKQVLDLCVITTDKKLRQALAEYNDKLRSQGKTREE